MTGIRVQKEKCNQCGCCVDACPLSLISIAGESVEIAFGCTFCGACVEACSQDAILISERERTACLDEYRGVWVFAEQRDGELMPATFELLGAGRSLANELQQELSVVLLGSDLEANIGSLKRYPIDRIYTASHELLEQYTTLPYAKVLAELIAAKKPEILLVAGTTIGRDLAPRLAVRVGSGLTADCTALEIDEETNGLIQLRPAFGGNIMAGIVTRYHRPQMATVRPKVMKPAPPAAEPQAVAVEDVRVSLDGTESIVTLIERIREESNVQDLQEADIIVSGGRGLGAPEHFSLIRELAKTLGGAVGASRAVVDAGWLPSYHQVGQTGKTVQPKLYVACGISGAIQHQVGMRGADMIIAVNKDPEAPIFNIATLGVVADVHKFLPVLIQQLQDTSAGDG